MFIQSSPQIFIGTGCIISITIRTEQGFSITILFFIVLIAPIVTMGSERDYFLSKSGPPMNDKENTALSVPLT